MKLDIQTVKPKMINLLKKAKTYALPIIIIIIVAVNGFLVYQINFYTQKEPTQEQITSQKNSIKRLNIDEDSISKIQQLEDQNIAVQALFNEARANPFVNNE